MLALASLETPTPPRGDGGLDIWRLPRLLFVMASWIWSIPGEAREEPRRPELWPPLLGLLLPVPAFVGVVDEWDDEWEFLRDEEVFELKCEPFVVDVDIMRGGGC